MSIASLEDLQAGDIMIAGQTTAPAKITVYLGQWLLHEQFRMGEFVAGHAAVVVPGGKIVEAMPGGARLRNLSDEDWTGSQAFLRLPEDYPGQALDAANVALAMIGTPYSVASYVYLAAYIDGFRPQWLANKIDKRNPHTAFMLPSGRWTEDDLPHEAICSVLAEQAWTLTGKEVLRGTVPQVATPGMLAMQLWERPGVIKGAAWIG